MTTSEQPVCLITGVGDGTGASCARRFAAGGYRVAMLARKEERLRALEAELDGAKGYICDVSDLDALRATMNQASDDLGAPSVAIHNAVAGAFKTVLEADPIEFEHLFRVSLEYF